jgi:hypothetical protein
MSGPAETSSHEPNSYTCDISPTHNDCRRAKPGGSAAQSQHPRRSTNRPACGRHQPYGRRHRTALSRLPASSSTRFYGRFGPEPRISLALACPRFNCGSPPRGMDAGDWPRAAGCGARVGVLARRSVLAAVVGIWHQLARPDRSVVSQIALSDQLPDADHLATIGRRPAPSSQFSSEFHAAQQILESQAERRLSNSGATFRYSSKPVR